MAGARLLCLLCHRTIRKLDTFSSQRLTCLCAPVAHVAASADADCGDWMQIADSPVFPHHAQALHLLLAEADMFVFFSTSCTHGGRHSYLLLGQQRILLSPTVTAPCAGSSSSPC